MSATAPRIFISYSHDDESHKDWVRSLAENLVRSGIDVILDQWDNDLGDDLAYFMEHSVSESDRVLCICTNQYNHKADSKSGGVGFESTYIRGELLSTPDSNKMVPVVRNVSHAIKLPKCLLGKTFIDFSNNAEYRQKLDELIRHLYGKKKYVKPALGTNPLEFEDEKKRIDEQDPTNFFYERFCIAFPGVRGHKLFQSGNAAKLLSVLLKEPTTGITSSPIWWWGRGNMQIERVSLLSADTLLVGPEEWKIKEIVANRATNNSRNFVYVECAPQPQTGLYQHSSSIAICSSEEYGLYKGHLLTRGEYDDGAAIINGEHIDCGSEAELRVRYIAPYNLIIAPHNSPINSHVADMVLRGILDGLLTGTHHIQDLISAVNKLPAFDGY